MNHWLLYKIHSIHMLIIKYRPFFIEKKEKCLICVLNRTRLLHWDLRSLEEKAMGGRGKATVPGKSYSIFPFFWLPPRLCGFWLTLGAAGTLLMSGKTGRRQNCLAGRPELLSAAVSGDYAEKLWHQASGTLLLILEGQTTPLQFRTMD